MEILDFLEILEFLELIFRRADCDPSDDRPCTTTHLQRQGLSIFMPIFRRISIYVYVYIYICIDTPTNTITNTSTDIDHLLNAQANTSINIHITRLYSPIRICLIKMRILINNDIHTPTHINNHIHNDISVY